VDFAAFQVCFTGDATPLSGLSQACACVDVEPDGNIDGFDATAFETCASGPGVPADPTCGG